MSNGKGNPPPPSIADDLKAAGSTEGRLHAIRAYMERMAVDHRKRKDAIRTAEDELAAWRLMLPLVFLGKIVGQSRAAFMIHSELKWYWEEVSRGLQPLPGGWSYADVTARIKLAEAVDRAAASDGAALESHVHDFRSVNSGDREHLEGAAWDWFRTLTNERGQEWVIERRRELAQAARSTGMEPREFRRALRALEFDPGIDYDARLLIQAMRTARLEMDLINKGVSDDDDENRPDLAARTAPAHKGEMVTIAEIRAEIGKLPNPPRKLVVEALLKAHPARLKIPELKRAAGGNAHNTAKALAKHHPFFRRCIDPPGAERRGEGYGLKNIADDLIS